MWAVNQWWKGGTAGVAEPYRVRGRTGGWREKKVRGEQEEREEGRKEGGWCCCWTHLHLV